MRMRLLGRCLARWTGDDRWTEWTPEILSHIVQGAICGGAMALPFVVSAADGWLTESRAWAAFASGALWMTWSYCYQHAGFLRKGDTIARDWRDYLGGWPLGFASLLLIVNAVIR